MGKTEDLTGQRFGKLTVQKRDKNRKGRVAWICTCDCGGTKTATARDLKAGKIKSCGCLRHTHRGNRVDLAGRRFGRLVCLYPTSRRDGRGSVYWRCRCDCGKETEITAARLIHGNYKSCGCLKQENQQKLGTRLQHVEGTCVEILEKRRHRNDNTSGFRGVFLTKSGTYRVYIGFRGTRFYLGTFQNYEEAVQVRKEAEEKLYKPFLHQFRQWKERADKDPYWAEENPFRARDLPPKKTGDSPDDGPWKRKRL